MKISITYQNNITQILDLVDKIEYLTYKTLKELFKDEKEFKKYPIDEQERIKNGLFDLRVVGEKIDSGKFCTFDSPIFKSLETQILILPDIQGGCQNVKTFIYEQ